MLIQAVQLNALAAIHLPEVELRIAGTIGCPHCEAKYPLVINAKEDVPWLTSLSTSHIQLLADAISMDHQSGHPVTQFVSDGISVSNILVSVK
jgi:hypothetical protein